MYKTISLITIFSLLLTSCCKVFLDPTSRLIVTAGEPETEITIDGYYCGIAPVQVDLDKTYNHLIVASKPGYQEKTILLKSRRTFRAATNMGIWPLLGAAIGTAAGVSALGPFYFIGTAWGTYAGLGLGVAGTAIDIKTKADYDLTEKTIHFSLTK